MVISYYLPFNPYAFKFVAGIAVGFNVLFFYILDISLPFPAGLLIQKLNVYGVVFKTGLPCTVD
jgi:hypothetical protein